MSDTKRTVCFTGHREIVHPNIASMLDTLLTRLVKNDYRYFRVGGALGFDTEAALSVLRVQEKHPQIKLILVLPYPAQAKAWSADEQEMYEDIKSRAEKIIYTSESYKRGCFHIRNRSLVDEAAVCVSYLVKHEGGTAYTVGYARKKGIETINIAQGTAS